MHLTVKKLSICLILVQLFLAFPLYAGKKINLSISPLTLTDPTQNSTQSTSTSEENPGFSISVSSTSNGEDLPGPYTNLEQLSDFTRALSADILNDLELLRTGQTVTNPDIDLSAYSDLELTDKRRLSVFDVTVQPPHFIPIQSNEPITECAEVSSPKILRDIEGNNSEQANRVRMVLNRKLNAFSQLLPTIFTPNSNGMDTNYFVNFIFILWIDEYGKLNLYCDYKSYRISTPPTVPSQTPPYSNASSGCSLM